MPKGLKARVCLVTLWSSKVSVLWRIYLLVTLFFVLVTILGLALLLRQASEDVQREGHAAEAVVEYLYETARRDPPVSG